MPTVRLGSPTDGEEREADEVAERVVGRLAFETHGTSALMGAGDTTQRIEIQRGAGSVSRPLPADASSPHRGAGELERQMAEARSEGTPLDAPLRRDMEGAFGHGFSGVKVHRGPRAAALSERLDARAFTHASDIFFNRDEFDPGTSRGRRLIAHELAHTVQQGRAPAPVIRRQEKIDKGDVRLLTPKTQISAAEVAILAEKQVSTSGASYDLVVSSGSKDAAFTKLAEKIALFVASAFKEGNFRSVLALDFSAVDWTKAGVTEAATKKKFGSGLHAFELIRWDGGTKLQLRMNYLKEITEISASDSAAKIKAGKTKFSTASFSFKAPTAAEKQAGYKDWTASEQDIVYMAVSRVPDAMLRHAHVKGIEFYRVKNTAQFSAQYDQTQHRVNVSDDAYQITEGATTTTLSSPAALYRQSSGVAGDVASGFTSGTEYTIIHEISHALDWGPIRPELRALLAASARFNAALQEVTRIQAEYKKASDANDAKEKTRLETLFTKARGDYEKAQTDLATAIKAIGTKTTLSGTTYAETGPSNVAEINPAAATDFEKAIAGKTPSTPYAATDTGEAFAEGLTLYIVNPGLLKEYRPELYAYFKKLLP